MQAQGWALGRKEEGGGALRGGLLHVNTVLDGNRSRGGDSPGLKDTVAAAELRACVKPPALAGGSVGGSTVPYPGRLQAQFSAGAHAWVAGLIPGRGAHGRPRIDVSLSR